MRRFTFLGALALLLWLPGSSPARIIHVPADSLTIQGGIDGASSADTVLVAPGTYHEHDISFRGKAILVTSVDPEDSTVVAGTVVDADSLGRVFLFVLGETPNSILSGFTITGAGGTQNGGGIYCDASSPQITKNVITGNQARSGGGIYSKAGGAPSIVGNVISGNYASTNNPWAYNEGGGIRCVDATIKDNRIEGNRADDLGGGIMCYRSNLVSITNNVLVGNSAGGKGGAIAVKMFGTYVITNNTITGNRAEGAGGGALHSVGADTEPSLRNCILWDNAPSEISEETGATVRATYSDVKGGWPGAGNIDTDPLFFDGAGGDVHLRQDPPQPGIINPCVDTGDPDSPILVGATRTDGFVDVAVIDMGYHYPPDLSGNIPPYARFGWSPARPATDRPIQFDASASLDPDGTIVSYEWDWDSDGLYDDSLAVPVATHSWSVPDSYPVTLRVTDEMGARGNWTETVAVAPADEYTVVEEWVSAYDGPDGLADAAVTIALDGRGNVFVAGYSTTDGALDLRDCLTIKYDRDGREIWVAQDGQSAKCSCTASVADDSGNVYVTGYDLDPEFWGVGHWPIIKYSETGERLWFVESPGLAWNDPPEGANDIVLDREGNILIAGILDPGAEQPSDAGIFKYSPDGVLLWWDAYNGAADWIDRANALAVDSAGNSYMTGGSYGVGTLMDYLTIVHDAQGRRLAIRTYDGPANGNDEARDVAVDDGGFLYVTGWSEGDSSGLDYATIKYDAQGNTLWIARYDGPGNGDDQARALVVDDAGNVFVTGSSAGATGSTDYATVKYGPGGEELWVVRYDGPAGQDDSAADIGIDRRGNVVVTGNVTVLAGGGIPRSVYGTIKYSPGGLELWSMVHSVGGADAHAGALAVDLPGNAWVAGHEHSPVDVFDARASTVKYREFRIGIDPYPTDSLRVGTSPR